MGRGREGAGGPAARSPGRSWRADRTGEGAQGASLCAQDGRVPGEPTAHPRRKGRQEGASGALLGGPRPQGQLVDSLAPSRRVPPRRPAGHGRRGPGSHRRCTAGKPPSPRVGKPRDAAIVVPTVRTRQGGGRVVPPWRSVGINNVRDPSSAVALPDRLRSAVPTP